MVIQDQVPHSAREIDIPIEVGGWTLERCYVDSSFGVMFIRRNDAFEFRIGGQFKIRHAGTEVGYSIEYDYVAKVSGALRLLHKTARTAIALKDGTLEIVFIDGDVLLVPPDLHYEAWEMSGPNGLKIVSLPGGGLAFWSARDPVDPVEP